MRLVWLSSLESLVQRWDGSNRRDNVRVDRNPTFDEENLMDVTRRLLLHGVSPVHSTSTQLFWHLSTKPWTGTENLGVGDERFTPDG